MSIINFLKFKRLTWGTVDSWITNVVDRTSADWAVIIHVTQCISTARIPDDARIHAEGIYALFIIGTFAVSVAFWANWWQ